MIDEFISSFGSGKFIESANQLLDQSAAMISASFSNILYFFLALAVGLLVIGFVFRILMGAHCTWNRVISGSIEVLFIYFITVVIYATNPWKFAQYLSPLPFAIFRRDILIITSIVSDAFSVVSSQILSMLILCFIIHVLNFLLPTGGGVFRWIFWRLITVALAIFLNLAANWTLNTFLPEVAAAYASTAVIVILAAGLVIGLFNPLLCVIFTVANPVFGLLYTFFFSNAFGKQLTKAVFSTALICAVFYIAEYLGFGVINITVNSIITYLPFVAVLMGTWYIFDRKF